MKIRVVSPGYVRLPFVVEFVGIEETIGFDVNRSRVKELFSGTEAPIEGSDREYDRS